MLIKIGEHELLNVLLVLPLQQINILMVQRIARCYLQLIG